MRTTHSLVKDNIEVIFEGKLHSAWTRITTPVKETVVDVNYARRYFDLLLRIGFRKASK